MNIVVATGIYYSEMSLLFAFGPLPGTHVIS